MPNDSTHEAKESLEHSHPRNGELSPAAAEANLANRDLSRQEKIAPRVRKQFTWAKSTIGDNHVTESLSKVEVSKPDSRVAFDAHFNLDLNKQTSESFKFIEALHNNQAPDLKEKSEAFTMFQKLTPSEQCQIVQHLGLKHLNEIHGLERMNKYPPERLPKLIIPGEVVDLANSKNIIDKEFASRNLDSYNCMDYALRRMKGGVQAWQDKVGQGAGTVANSEVLKFMGINEVYGQPVVGDLVAIKENFFGFRHAGVVESVSKDKTITVIEKLGSMHQLPVIRQTLQDFARTWEVAPAEIRFFRKE